MEFAQRDRAFSVLVVLGVRPDTAWEDVLRIINGPCPTTVT
ncbi:hypothetical protein [Marivita sp. XM-24bin2]|nr:hypothetical protein [Marivita sp. XM-24bin2]